MSFILHADFCTTLTGSQKFESLGTSEAPIFSLFSGRFSSGFDVRSSLSPFDFRFTFLSAFYLSSFDTLPVYHPDVSLRLSLLSC